MKRFLTRLRWLFTPQDKKKFLLLAMLMSISALLEMAGIGLLLAAAALFLSPQTAVSENARQILTELMPGAGSSLQVATVVAGIAFLLMLKNLFALWIVDRQSRFISGKQSELARRVFDTFIYADSESFRRIAPEKSFADLARITQLSNLVLLPGMQMISDILVITVLMVTMLVLFPLITTGTLLFMLTAAAVIGIVTRKVNRRLGKKCLQYENVKNEITMTGIAGEKSIKAAGAGKFFSGKFSVAYRNYAACLQKLYTLGQIPRFALESASFITAAGVFCIMLAAGMAKSEIMIVFAVLTAAVARMLPALSRCHYNLSLLVQSTPLLENTVELLKNIPQEDLSVTGSAADAGKVVKFDNISFAYQDGREDIFSGFSLELPPLSFTAIAGRSGRGKSTLAELMLGLLKVRSGEITAGGINICNDIAAWRRQIGFVPQNVFVAPGTLRENVAFGIAPEEIDDEKVTAALQIAQLAGLSPDTGVSAARLSGGQQQRLGIARALYRDVKLLILDEATSALDPATEKDFIKALEAMRGRVTLLLISHRESTLQYCDRVIEL